MNEYHYKFARRMGETPLRPDYANPIEHYKSPDHGSVYWFTVVLVIIILVSTLYNMLDGYV